MESNPLTINGLKDAFFSLEVNKSSRYEVLTFLSKRFGELYDTLKLYLNYRLKKESSMMT